MAGSVAEPELKAAGFNSSMQVARELVGEAAFDRFVEKLPPELADLIKRPRLATNWLSFTQVMTINERILDDLMHGDLEKVFELGRRQFKADLNSIYKVFVRVGSVNFIAKRTAVLYGTYTRNCGTMSVVREEPNLLEVEVNGHPLARPGLWHYLRGNVHGGAEASGAKNVKSLLVEASDVSQRARIRITWSS
jgi:hypothetical protein